MSFNLQKLNLSKYLKYIEIAETIVGNLAVMVAAEEAQNPNAPVSFVVVIQKPTDPVPAGAVSETVTL
jgi:hypothetical protein